MLYFDLRKMNKIEKTDKDKIKEQKSIDIIDNFVNNLPQEKIKFDEFSMLEEITNTKIDYQQIQDIFAEKIKQIGDEKIKTINEI